MEWSICIFHAVDVATSYAYMLCIISKLLMDNFPAMGLIAASPRKNNDAES